jgi:hypothetical protein
MRIRWVKAEAFGALADKELHLSEGLNVIVGPNDSGKSTWHAAMFAALCGHPPQSDEATDAQSAADNRFRRDRRPRRLSGWSVEAEIEFDPDHRILVQQNLLVPLTSTVRSLDDESDVDGLNDLEYPGGIDTSRLVGLNRRAYAATAWVPQGRAMFLDDEASREELRRVISEYVDDDAARLAGDRIREYRRSRIGSETDFSTELGQTAALATRRRNEREQARLLADSRVRAERELQSAQENLTGLQRELRVAEALAAKARAKRIGEEVTRLTADVEQLRAELARLHGNSVGPNTQSAAVYKFPGYIDKDSETDDGFAHGPIAATATDPLGTGGFRKEERDPPPVNAPVTATLPVAEPYPPVPIQIDLGQSGGRSLDAMEGVLFPVLFFGGLVLAGIGLVMALAMQTMLGVVLAVAAAVLAVIGLVVRFAVRRGRERREAEWITTMERIKEPEGVEEPVNVSPIAIEPVYEDETPPEPDDPRIKEYEAHLADADRRLRLMQQEQWQANDEAARQAAGLNPYELYASNDDLEEALRAKERAKDDMDAGARAVAEREHELDEVVRRIGQYASVADAEVALARAEARVAELRHRDRLLEETLEHLGAAVAAAREKIADGVETRLREYLPEITRYRHSLVDVDEGLRVRVGDQTQPMDDPTPGSRGTVEQTHLLRLIALGRHLGYGHEAGPLLLDDVTSNADSRRLPRILELLYRISEQRQVVVFAHEDAVGDWALERAPADSRITVYSLDSVDKPPVMMTQDTGEL